MTKKSKPAFSVVIPCYKLGEHVINAIESVESQTLGNIEIILVDDASPDTETQEMLESLRDRVKVIHRKKNGGASAARNTGIKAAKSNYILCLDADDTIAPTYLEDAFNLLESRPDVGVVAPHVKMTGERSGSWKPKAENATIPQALVSSPIPNASCYRKEVWKDAGGYDEELRGMEDWEFWISVLEKDWIIEVIPKPHYIYLNRPDSKVKTSNKNAHAIVNHIVTKHHDTFSKHMNYVIAGTHKKYVDERTRARDLEAGLSDPNSSKSNFILNFAKKASKIPRKAKTAASILFIDRDIDEIKNRIKKQVKK